METGLFDRKGNVVKIPLRHVDISGNVIGLFGEFTLRQVYENTTSDGIEILYTFPLSDTASVTAFQAIIGEKTVIGEIQESDKAYETYENSVRKGDSAFLLESRRPNIFQISLGQILPDETVEIVLTYLDEYKAIDDEMRMIIPTVVAPRYIHGTPVSEIVGPGSARPTGSVLDADFISPPIGSVEYKVTFNIEVNPLRKITTYESPSHNIQVASDTNGNLQITLVDGEAKMDRDFILVCKFAEEASSGGVAVNLENGEQIVCLSMMPELPSPSDDSGREYIFLIDISGSMSGIKLDQAKTALNICIRNLGAADTFNIVAFESSNHFFSKTKMPFNQLNLDKATRWINNLEALGGTEIYNAIRFSLKPGEQEKAIFLITDGEVGNEAEIMSFIKKNIANGRLFTFGIDTAVNAYFINGAAEAGNGKAEFVYPGEKIDDKAVRQFSRITSKPLEKATLNWGKTQAYDIIPEKLPLLYDLEPQFVIAKIKGEMVTPLKVKGMFGNTPYEIEISPESIVKGKNTNLVSKIWAKHKIKILEEQSKQVSNKRRVESIKEEIIELSITYGVLSSLTSFVAVYERTDKASGLPKTVVVPVSMPYSWEMEIQSPMGLMDNLFGGTGIVGMCKMSCYEEIDNYNNSPVEILNRQELLKILARNQNADGSFPGINHDEEDEIAVTALAVIAFIAGHENKTIYKKQLEKSAKYLMEKANTGKFNNEESVLILLALAYCLNINILKKALVKEAEVLISILGSNISCDAQKEKVSKILVCLKNNLTKESNKILLESIGISSLDENDLRNEIDKNREEKSILDVVAKLSLIIESDKEI